LSLFPGFIQEPSTGGTATSSRQQFREFTIGGTISPNDPFNINTGVWDTAGAQSVFASYGTLVMPTSATDFRDDTRIRVWLNGISQSKGANAGDNRDCYYISTVPPKIAFNVRLRVSNYVKIESPSAYPA